MALRSDCRLLHDHEWLNDQVMAFYLEYLRQEAFENVQHEILLLDPSTAFMLTSLPAESAPMLLQPLKADSKLMVRATWQSMLTVRLDPRSLSHTHPNSPRIIFVKTPEHHSSASPAYNRSMQEPRGASPNHADT